MVQRTEDRGQGSEDRGLRTEDRVLSAAQGAFNKDAAQPLNNLSSVLSLLSSVSSDSRSLKPGDTFLAYPGGQVDGRQFIAQAIANGAKAVIWEPQGFSWDETWRVPNLAVSDLRLHAARIADYVYGNPSGKLWMIGVTGTNGKTSCSHWLAQALGALGKKTALIGTLGNGFPGCLQPTLNTTPDAVRLHGLLADYLSQGADAVAMEVSSHALEQGRVREVRYDVALLTNLSRDHLDYHGEMQHYAASKRLLFENGKAKYAVLNLDDEFGSELAAQLRDADVEVVGYGLNDSSLALAERLGIRMVFGGALHTDARGINLQVHSSWGGSTLRSQLLGRFNAENLLGALAVLLVSEVALGDAVRELEQVKAVAGRMQTLGGAGRPTVVVDYAHTPDALENVLRTLREVTNGKLVCVFGCGGDRDRGKRPMMGKIAAKLADACIVTNDNPRNEQPHDIFAAVVSDMNGFDYQIIEERATAITHAIQNAAAQDTVLLAGKGHELYQEVKGVKYPFSDVEVAQAALATWCLQSNQISLGARE